MNPKTRLLLAASCSVALLAQAASSALAFPPPIGAVAGAQKLQKGMGNGKDDLVFSPLLLEMAKLIGRTGLSPGFFLQNDSNFDEPGVDLRTLLLYQAGLIKMPIRLITGKHTAAPKPDPLPTLLVPTIPDPRPNLNSAENPTADVPSLASTPLPRDPESTQVVTPPEAQVGEPGQISFRDATSASSATQHAEPLVSLDVAPFRLDEIQSGEANPDDPSLHAQMPRLAMAMPRTSAMPFITNNAFRLWTFRPDGNAANAGPTDFANTGAFHGSYVVATTGAIKSITGRHFSLGSGRLLANNKGGDMLLQTELATIAIAPESTAVVDVSTQGANTTVKVYALEAQGLNSVEVTLPSGKVKSVDLRVGEAMVIANHPITAQDLTTSRIATKAPASGSFVKGTFSVNQFVDNELMLKSRAEQQNHERYATLSSLKRRLEQH